MYIGFIQLKSVDFDCMYAVRIHFFALLFGMQLLIIFPRFVRCIYGSAIYYAVCGIIVEAYKCNTHAHTYSK